MTPSTTFQCPLSPSGTFQPEKSRPLKSEAKPSGGFSSAAGEGKAVAASRQAARAIQRVRGMTEPPWGTAPTRRRGGDRLSLRRHDPDVAVVDWVAVVLQVDRPRLVLAGLVVGL